MNNVPTPDQQKNLNDPSVSVIIDTFVGVDWYSKLKSLPVFTIYDSPKDFPDKYVCRLFDGRNPTRLITVAGTLDAIRETIDTGWFVRFQREVDDDPIIVETWM